MGSGYGQMQNDRTPGPGKLLQNEMWSARIEALAAMTGKSTATIEKELQKDSFYLVLQNNNVSQEDFQAIMHGKVVALVQKAVEDGKITKEQGDAMFEQMSQGPQNHRRGGQ